MKKTKVTVSLAAMGMMCGLAAAQNNGPPARAVTPQGAGGSGLGSAQLFAVVVGSTGAIARGKGDTTTPGGVRLGVGTYDVRFTRSVLACSYIAMVGGTNLDTPSGVANATNRAGAANGVFVQTRNAAGALTDLSFHLHVDC